jgi:ubiquinone/menaquinone biosynthesis C-methylase UbiE
MKTRESGMPEEALWSTFFDPEEVLRKLGLTGVARHAVDFGCGYGTFTIPAARIVKGTVFAIDIDPAMVAATRAKAASAGLHNVVAYVKDFVAEGSGLPDQHADYVMLFNILHAEDPLTILREAWRITAVGGILAVTHWNYDPGTPRGPSMEIRPRPQQCRAWAIEAGFRPLAVAPIDLPPHHYGLTFRRF